MGFVTTADNTVTAFRKHHDWLYQNGLGKYFETNIVDPLESIGALKDGKNVTERMTPFLKFWSKACDQLWSSAILTLEDQKYWALLKLEEKYKYGFFPEPNRYHHIFVDEFQDVNPLGHCIGQGVGAR